MLERVQIRVQGSPEKLKEAIDRIRRVLSVTKQSDPYPSTKHTGEYLVYITAYLYKNGIPHTFEEEYLSFKQECLELEARLGELSLENEKLREQLGQLPQPDKYSAVLGSKHHHGLRH